jgi:hypothetical protein
VKATTTTSTRTTHARHDDIENGFNALQEQESYKASYRMSKQWQVYTADSIHPQHMVTSIQLWTQWHQTRFDASWLDQYPIILGSLS